MNKLVAQLRIKNGILFIENWLNRMSELVDEIVVVDNGSTDGTLETINKNDSVVDLEQTEGFHEGRDRILLYEMARKRKADWHIWLDVDEIFEKRLKRDNLIQLMQDKRYIKYYFRRINFHLDYQHFEARFDKLLAQSCWSRVMWKEQPTGYINNKIIHVGNIQGITGEAKFLTKYRIKHLGSVNKDYLDRKTAIYINVDPSRKNLYQKNRDQKLSTWKWYEYDENKLITKIQTLILNSLYIIAYPIKWIRRKLLDYKTDYSRQRI